MEQKKLLLVFVSVGVFLVIVLGAGILVFRPSAKPAAAQTAALPRASSSAPASADPSEWVRNPQSVPGLQPPAASGSNTRGDVIIIYGERPSASIGGSATPSPAAQISGDGQLKVDVGVPAANPTPPAPETPRPSGSPTATVAKTTPAAKAERTPAAKAPAPAKQPAAKAAPRSGDEFWIQTGSFTAKARADAAKETLGGKGIASLVETKELSGKIYFRVRVGPYSTKNEADYWLSLVKTIDGFDGSYVSLIKAKR